FVWRDAMFKVNGFAANLRQQKRRLRRHANQRLLRFFRWNHQKHAFLAIPQRPERVIVQKNMRRVRIIRAELETVVTSIEYPKSLLCVKSDAAPCVIFSVKGDFISRLIMLHNDSRERFGRKARSKHSQRPIRAEKKRAHYAS